jgi:hypothetical protein
VEDVFEASFFDQLSCTEVGRTAWGVPGENILEGAKMPLGGELTLYSRITDIETSAPELNVSLSIRQQGAEWTLLSAPSYRSDKNYWYVTWIIEGSNGMYDVKVSVNDGELLSSQIEVGLFSITQ